MNVKILMDFFKIIHESPLMIQHQKYDQTSACTDMYIYCTKSRVTCYISVQRNQLTHGRIFMDVVTTHTAHQRDTQRQQIYQFKNVHINFNLLF